MAIYEVVYCRYFFESAEIIAIHEASRECVWLRSVIHVIKERCGLKCDVKIPTILFEDNAACIAQL